MSDVRKGAEGLKDEQVSFLNTSVQAVQAFAGMLLDATTSASPAITSRSSVSEEMNSALQNLQHLIFSAKSLLVATGAHFAHPVLHLNLLGERNLNENDSQ